MILPFSKLLEVKNDFGMENEARAISAVDEKLVHCTSSDVFSR